jgi:hypothetical protein
LPSPLLHICCYTNTIFLQAESKEKTSEDAGRPGELLGPPDLGLGVPLSNVKDQVPDAVDEVVGEGEGEEGELEEALDEEGERGEPRGEAGALDVEADEGRDEVGGEVGVGGAREDAAGDAGPGGGGEPDLAELVDAQVRGDGAGEALLGEDVLALGQGDLGGGGGGTGGEGESV